MIKQFVVFALVLAILLPWSTGAYLKTKKQERLVCTKEVCECVSGCDLPSSTLRIINNIIENAYNSISDETRTCALADFIRNQLNTKYAPILGNGWVVLIGTNRLLTNRIEFGSKHNYVGKNFIQIIFRGKHDIEIFQAKSNPRAPNDLSRGLVYNKEALKEISPLVLDNIKTDMSFVRALNFELAINEAIDNSDGEYKNSLNQMFNEIQTICDGEWVFLISTHGTMYDEHNFCASYESYNQTNFAASWQRPGSPNFAHDVIVFAPKAQDI